MSEAFSAEYLDVLDSSKYGKMPNSDAWFGFTSLAKLYY